MAEARDDVANGVVVEEQVVFTLTALCRATGANPAQLSALVHEGLLVPAGEGPDAWRFDGGSLSQARTALRLARDLGIGLEGAAVVMDLLAEIAALRAQLRWAGVP